MFKHPYFAFNSFSLSWNQALIDFRSAYVTQFFINGSTNLSLWWRK